MPIESKIQSVPFIFRKEDVSLYPADNYPSAEYWFSQNIKEDDIIGERVYLPIGFTQFYKNVCDYGNNKLGIKILQDFLDKLDTSKKYFCICQYDDGILNDISHLDIKVFSMAGGRKDYGLPLIAQPHRLKFNNKRDIFCSFVGRITNPIRQEIVNAYIGKQGYFVSTKAHSLPDYCEILSRSIFCLCCRGYGANSFRIQESLEYGAIPVWISDEYVPIHNLDFNIFGVVIPFELKLQIDDILKSFSTESIIKMQNNGRYVLENYFTFEANKKLILENI